MYVGGWVGEQPVIPEPHNHCTLQCQLQMREVSEAGLCIFLGPAQPQEGVPQKSTGVSDGKPSSGGGDSSHGGSSKATPKKDGKAATTNSQGSSTLSASQPSPHHSGWGTSHHHKSHKKDSAEKRKVNNMSPAQKSTGHQAHKDGGCH